MKEEMHWREKVIDRICMRDLIQVDSGIDRELIAAYGLHLHQSVIYNGGREVHQDIISATNGKSSNDEVDRTTLNHCKGIWEGMVIKVW